jgi:phospholipid/cholesterol/gamma-HCH transport system substrate-binding protein
MQRSSVQTLVGLFVTAALAAMVFLAVKVAGPGGFSAPPSYLLHAAFSNIGGLKVRAPVKSAGVVVGRVSAITLDTQLYQAQVEMLIENRYTFSRDSSVSVVTSGLLGEQYLSMDAGSEADLLKPGDSLHFTASALVLENILRTLGLKAYEKSQQKVPTNEPIEPE